MAGRIEPCLQGVEQTSHLEGCELGNNLERDVHWTPPAAKLSAGWRNSRVCCDRRASAGGGDGAAGTPRSSTCCRRLISVLSNSSRCRHAEFNRSGPYFSPNRNSACALRRLRSALSARMAAIIRDTSSPSSAAFALQWAGWKNRNAFAGGG